MTVALCWLHLHPVCCYSVCAGRCSNEPITKGVRKITFGKRLRELRKSKSISQLDLAAKIGVSRQTLSKWENDAVLPDIPNVIALAEFFHVTTDYLLRGIAPGSESSADRDLSLRDQILNWARDRNHWLYIFVAVYILFVVLMWAVLIGPSPQPFPIG